MKKIYSCKNRGTVWRKFKQILKFHVLWVFKSWISSDINSNIFHWKKKTEKTLKYFAIATIKTQNMFFMTYDLWALSCHSPPLPQEEGSHCFAFSEYKTCVCFRTLYQWNYSISSFVSVFLCSLKYFWYTCY